MGCAPIPVVLGIARDMDEVCPDAWLLNYTNPLAILVRAVAEATSIKVVGLCHSVFWTIDTLAGYLGLPRDEIDAESRRGQPPRLPHPPRASRVATSIRTCAAFVEAGGRPPTTSSGPTCSGASAPT